RFDNHDALVDIKVVDDEFWRPAILSGDEPSRLFVGDGGIDMRPKGAKAVGSLDNLECDLRRRNLKAFDGNDIRAEGLRIDQQIDLGREKHMCRLEPRRGVDGEPLQGCLATRRREVGSLERDRRAGNGAAIFFKRRDDNRADREIDGRDGDTDNRDDTDHDECENASHMFRSLPAVAAGATYAAPPGAASLILTAGSEAGDGKRPAKAAFSRARSGPL